MMLRYAAYGYDGYIDIPLATRNGDYKNPTKLLFYSAPHGMV